MQRVVSFALLALASPVLLGAASTRSDVTHTSEQLARRGVYLFSGWAGPPLRVFYQLPDTVTPDTPVLIVIHGVNRDADVYRDNWARHAVANGFIVAAPEYSRAEFPDNESFGSGDLADDAGAPRARNRWSFAAIDPLFADVKARTGTTVARYYLYGHSGGAQFVQRFVMFMPDARYRLAIAANAGWYTQPNFNAAMPYGLQGSPIDAEGLKAAFKRPLLVLSGGKDTDPRSPNLRTTPEAMQQGTNRLARGDYFYAAAKDESAKLGVPLGWQRRYVAGIGHDNSGIAAAIAPIIRH